MNEYLSLSEAAELIGKSKETLRRWDKEGKLSAVREPMSNYRVYKKAEVQMLFSSFLVDNVETVSNYENPENNYTVLELFAGAGGLAVGILRSVGVTGRSVSQLSVCLQARFHKKCVLADHGARTNSEPSSMRPSRDLKVTEPVGVIQRASMPSIGAPLTVRKMGRSRELGFPRIRERYSKASA